MVLNSNVGWFKVQQCCLLLEYGYTVHCRAAGRPVLSTDGVVVEGPKFPLLPLLARIHPSVDSTICYSKREFSIFVPTLHKLRRRMDAERVCKMELWWCEVTYVNMGLEGIRVVQKEVRGQFNAAQDEGAVEIKPLYCSGYP